MIPENRYSGVKEFSGFEGFSELGRTLGLVLLGWSRQVTRTKGRCSRW